MSLLPSSFKTYLFVVTLMRIALLHLLGGCGWNSTTSNLSLAFIIDGDCNVLSPRNSRSTIDLLFTEVFYTCNIQDMAGKEFTFTNSVSSLYSPYHFVANCAKILCQNLHQCNMDQCTLIRKIVMAKMQADYSKEMAIHHQGGGFEAVIDTVILSAIANCHSGGAKNGNSSSHCDPVPQVSSHEYVGVLNMKEFDWPYHPFITLIWDITSFGAGTAADNTVSIYNQLTAALQEVLQSNEDVLRWSNFRVYLGWIFADDALVVEHSMYDACMQVSRDLNTQQISVRCISLCAISSDQSDDILFVQHADGATSTSNCSPSSSATGSVPLVLDAREAIARIAHEEVDIRERVISNAENGFGGSGIGGESGTGNDDNYYILFDHRVKLHTPNWIIAILPHLRFRTLVPGFGVAALDCNLAVDVEELGLVLAPFMPVLHRTHFDAFWGKASTVDVNTARSTTGAVADKREIQDNAVFSRNPQISKQQQQQQRLQPQQIAPSHVLNPTFSVNMNNIMLMDIYRRLFSSACYDLHYTARSAPHRGSTSRTAGEKFTHLNDDWDSGESGDVRLPPWLEAGSVLDLAEYTGLDRYVDHVQLMRMHLLSFLAGELFSTREGQVGASSSSTATPSTPTAASAQSTNTTATTAAAEGCKSAEPATSPRSPPRLTWSMEDVQYQPGDVLYSLHCRVSPGCAIPPDGEKQAATEPPPTGQDDVATNRMAMVKLQHKTAEFPYDAPSDRVLLLGTCASARANVSQDSGAYGATPTLDQCHSGASQDSCANSNESSTSSTRSYPSVGLSRRRNSSSSSAAPTVRIAVITAIFGGYEKTCKHYAFQSVPVDFFCFTDDPTLHCPGWTVVTKPYHKLALIDEIKLNASRELNSLHQNQHPFNIAKFYKTSFHKIPILWGYDAIVWVDGTVFFHSSSAMEQLLRRMDQRGQNMIVFEHIRNGNLRAEAEASAHQCKYNSTNTFHCAGNTIAAAAGRATSFGGGDASVECGDGAGAQDMSRCRRNGESENSLFNSTYFAQPRQDILAQYADYTSKQGYQDSHDKWESLIMKRYAEKEGSEKAHQIKVDLDGNILPVQKSYPANARQYVHDQKSYKYMHVELDSKGSASLNSSGSVTISTNNYTHADRASDNVDSRAVAGALAGTGAEVVAGALAGAGTDQAAERVNSTSTQKDCDSVAAMDSDLARASIEEGLVRGILSGGSISASQHGQQQPPTSPLPPLPLRAQFGLWVTCMVAFDMRQPETRPFLDEWTAQLRRYSTQDQISFPFVAQRHHVFPHTLPDEDVHGMYAMNSLFIKLTHGV